MNKKIYEATIENKTLYILAEGKNEAIDLIFSTKTIDVLALRFSHLNNIHPREWSKHFITSPDSFTFDADIPDEEKHLYHECELIIESFKDFAERENESKIIKVVEL